MSTKFLLVFFVLTAALLAGCSQSPKSPAANNNSPAATNGNSSATATNSSSAGNAEKVGVAECDDFIANYETCISDHVPDAQKRQHQENINALRKSWRQLAATAGAKEALVLMCQRQVVQARESMSEFKCQF